MILTSLSGAGGAPSSSGSSSPNPTRIRRGVIISFDSATWTAVVQLDGSLGAVTLPAAHTISSDLLIANALVVVILLDDTNPDDAVIITTYGGVPPANVW